MKVFEVLTEHYEGLGKEIRRQRQYVTADDDDFALVATYFKNHCDQYEIDLTRIAEVATIVQHIKREE